MSSVLLIMNAVPVGVLGEFASVFRRRLAQRVQKLERNLTTAPTLTQDGDDDDDDCDLKFRYDCLTTGT